MAIQETNGWLDPDGDFYPVIHGHHSSAIEEIAGLSEIMVEELGWIKLSDGTWLSAHMVKPVTQSQFDFICEWHRALGRRMPRWVRTEGT